MVSSIEELRAQAFGLRKEGLNSQQIADELSLSQDTISWLLAGGESSKRREIGLHLDIELPMPMLILIYLLSGFC